MNNRVVFSHKSDEWATPDDLFKKLNQEFRFTLDACANEENHKCDRWFGIREDGLSMAWGGVFSAIPHTARSKNGWKRRM